MNNTATQIFKEAYEAKTGKVCDDLILENMAYAIEAMEVYKSQHHHTITDTEIERMAKEYAENENSAYTNDYYGFIAGAKAVLSMMPQSEGWVKGEDKRINNAIAYINGGLDGIEFNNVDDVYGKTQVLEILNDLKNILHPKNK